MEMSLSTQEHHPSQSSLEEPLYDESHTQIDPIDSQLEYSGHTMEDDEEGEAESESWGQLIPNVDKVDHVDLLPTEEKLGNPMNEVWIGRSKVCLVRVDNQLVSSMHCRIYCELATGALISDGMLEVYVEDRSSNGTWVNNQRLLKNRRRQLSSGDEITLLNPDRRRSEIKQMTSENKATSFTFLLKRQRSKQPLRSFSRLGGMSAGVEAGSSASGNKQGSSVFFNKLSAVSGMSLSHPADNNGAGSSPPTTRSASVCFGNIHAEYDMRQVIGNGTCGEVRRAVNRSTGKHVAVKVIQTKKFSLIPGLTQEELAQEADMLKAVKHPYIIQLEKFFKQDSTLYLVMELVEGGDLFDRIVERGKFPETVSSDIMFRVLTAVSYLHGKDIIHRDLKPENILMVSKENDVEVKITDFGLAKRANSDGLKTFCGTPQYFAPEVLKRRNTVRGAGRYGKGADMWSLGVILYILLSGTHPFHEATLYDQIAGAWYSMAGPEWDNISEDAKDLVKKLLVKNVTERLSAEEALAHPFISKRKRILGWGEGTGREKVGGANNGKKEEKLDATAPASGHASMPAPPTPAPPVAGSAKLTPEHDPQLGLSSSRSRAGGKAKAKGQAGQAPVDASSTSSSEPKARAGKGKKGQQQQQQLTLDEDSGVSPLNFSGLPKMLAKDKAAAVTKATKASTKAQKAAGRKGNSSRPSPSPSAMEIDTSQGGMVEDDIDEYSSDEGAAAGGGAVEEEENGAPGTGSKREKGKSQRKGGGGGGGGGGEESGPSPSLRGGAGAGAQEKGTRGKKRGREERPRGGTLEALDALSLRGGGAASDHESPAKKSTARKSAPSEPPAAKGKAGKGRGKGKLESTPESGDGKTNGIKAGGGGKGGAGSDDVGKETKRKAATPQRTLTALFKR